MRTRFSVARADPGLGPIGFFLSHFGSDVNACHPVRKIETDGMSATMTGEGFSVVCVIDGENNILTIEAESARVHETLVSSVRSMAVMVYDVHAVELPESDGDSGPSWRP